jgi:AsmA-like C-terminal region
MKRFKKILKITGISLATLILLLFLIPIVFKRQVQALVKREINKTINATVDFKDVKLSLFKNFPKATITIKGLTIVGKGEFAKDTLIAADKLDATAGLFSVLKGKDIKVHGLYAQNPRIHLLVNQFGRNNWDIAKPSTDTTTATDTTASNFKLNLKQYKISDGYLVYDDKVANTYMELEQLNHKGSGDFTADEFTLATSTEAAAFNFVQDNIPYLTNAKTYLSADVKINTKTNTYSFKTDDIQLNALQLATEGFIQMVNATTFNMDIKFSSPTNDFKNILSMVPAMFTKDFAAIKTSGKASFSGFVKGTYTPQQLPAYDVKLLVNDGSFQYPDLPKPVQHINLDVHAYNTDGKPDNSVVDIPKGHLEFDNEPFDFHFTYKNPETIQHIDAGAKGKLDLAQLSKFIKLDEGTKLSGILQADAFAKGPLQALQTMSGNFTAGGFFDVRNLFYSDKSFLQPIKNGNIKATINNSGGIADNTTIDISAAHIELGNDPVDFSLKLSQPVSAVNFDGHAKGRLTLDNLKQFGVLPVGTSLSGIVNADAGFAGSRAAINKEEYDKISMTGNAAFSNVNYKSAPVADPVKISAAALTFNTKTVTIDNATANYLGTNVSAKGSLSNFIGYMMDNQTLSGNVTANADNIDLNKWMGTTTASTAATTTTTSTAAPFAVPANMNVAIQTTANKVTYDKVDYTNISGSLNLNDEKIVLQNVKANALDGTVLINGSYATKVNKQKPDISLSYDIKNVDIQKAFLAYNTMQSLMPIGKFLAGKLHSELTMTGNLANDMMPLLNSLTGKGNMLLLEGVLAKFAPLEKIANALDVDRLKSISLKDIKNFIEFSNGKVLVKPFMVKVQDIEMEIGGFHGFDQSLDYNIKMKLPRSYMGSKGNALMNSLVSSANAKGLPIKLSDVVNLSLKLTGTVNNPSVAVNLKEVAGDAMKDLQKQVEDFAKAKADSLKQKATDSLNVIKNQAEQKLKEKLAEKGIDTAGVSIKNAKDTIVKRVTDTLKTRGKDSIKSKLRKLLGQ